MKVEYKKDGRKVEFGSLKPGDTFYDIGEGYAVCMKLDKDDYIDPGFDGYTMGYVDLQTGTLYAMRPGTMVTPATFKLVEV